MPKLNTLVSSSLRNRPSRKAYSTGVLVLSVALMAVACGGERLYGERSKAGKAYHNFTAHYNGYFNAGELITEAETQLEASAKTDYTEILPVFPAYASENPASAAPVLDKAMEKVSLVVNIHRPSDYDDDSYLLLGRAQLLKQDFESAQHTFEYSTKEFDPANEAARLRRIEKDRIADEKAKDKADNVRGGSTARKPPARRTSPQRRKSSPARSSSSSRKSSSSRGSSSSSTSTTDDKAAGSKSSDSKKLPKKKGKPKSRAEMAKEQREAKLAAQKEAVKAEVQAERDAEEADKKAAEAEAEKAAKIAEGDLPDASSALEDGAGLEAVTSDEKRPKHGIFVHEDARQDFDYWLARTYIARERYVDAERLLGALARSGSTFKRIRRQLPGAYADMHLRRDQHAEAVPYLEDAIALSRDKKSRARYAFILGQVHQRLGASKPAIASFRKVVKLKPSFDMVFNAQLNLLTTEYRVGDATAASALKELRRMSKEDKYIDQRDQIFYEMAEIALANGDREEGIGYMRESLAANAGNVAQAARGYLRLANLFFEDERYQLSSNYFDSTLQVLPNDDPRYAEITAYRDNLAPIAANLSTIALQDSLLAIAAMSPEDQKRFAAVLGKRMREAELAEAISASRKAEQQQKAASRGVAAAQASGATTARRASVGGGAAGAAAPVASFFAYDAKASRRGARDFQRKWGDRQLVDNWRTISKRESGTAVDLQDSLQIEATSSTEDDVASLLKDVPKDEDGLAKSNQLIAGALIGLGRQYRDKLNNPKRSVEALQELLRRYPDSEYTPEALYLLGLAGDESGDVAAANAARQRLKANYADSKFARALTDKDFFDEAKGAERRLIEYYDGTFDAFQRGDAAAARVRLQAVDKEFGADNPLQTRFALLTAMVTGKLDGREPYIASLKDVLARFPSSDEATKARDILRLLGERSSTTSALDGAAEVGKTAAEPSNFELATEQAHFFVAVLPKGANVAEARTKVSDYDANYHRLDKLTVGNVFMVSNGEQVPVVVVRRFDNQAAAMNYFTGATGKKAEFLGGVEFEAAVISQNNYREVLRNKSFAEYLQFFQDNYL